MATGEGRGGCLRYGCLGCLGVAGVAAIVVVITAALGWNAARSQEPREDVLTPRITLDLPPSPPESAPAAVAAPGEDLVVPVVPAGRIILRLENGDFHVEPGPPGEPLRVEANYDSNSFQLEEQLDQPVGEPWTYRLGFRQTGSGVLIGLSRLFGGSTPRVTVYLPPDAPLELELDMEEGGMSLEFGGLWLTRADLSAEKGGFQISVDEPLRMPMEELRLRGSMGGFQLGEIGNASPRILDVEFSMGGLELDLSGGWVADSEIRISAIMAGVLVELPRDVVLAGLEAFPRVQDPPSVELQGALPTLTFTTQLGKLGEIEFVGPGLRR